MKRKGKEIMVAVGGKVLAFATSHTLEYSNTFAEDKTKDDGDFADAEKIGAEWSVTIESLMSVKKSGEEDNKNADGDEFIDLIVSGQKVDLIWGKPSNYNASGVGETSEKMWNLSATADENTGPLRTGKAIGESFSLQAPVDGHATISVVFKGVGELKKLTAGA